jgi:hypothetical protein
MFGGLELALVASKSIYTGADFLVVHACTFSGISNIYVHHIVPHYIIFWHTFRIVLTLASRLYRFRLSSIRGFEAHVRQCGPSVFTISL